MRYLLQGLGFLFWALPLAMLILTGGVFAGGGMTNIDAPWSGWVANATMGVAVIGAIATLVLYNLGCRRINERQSPWYISAAMILFPLPFFLVMAAFILLVLPS